MPPEKKIPSASEIDQALKEFEMAKAHPEQVQINQALKEFEEKSAVETPQVSRMAPKGDEELPRMVRLIIKYSGGAIKEQKQAEYVLLGLTVLMFLASFYFFFK